MNSSIGNGTERAQECEWEDDNAHDTAVVVVPDRDDADNNEDVHARVGKPNGNGIGVAPFQYAYNFPHTKSLPKPPSIVLDGNHAKENNDDEDDEDDKYPQDSYSFLALNGPCDNFHFLFLGVLVFLFQVTFSVLMILSVVNKDLRTGDLGDGVDNPGNPNDAPGEEGWSSGFLPANASNLVRVTQITSILSFLIFADDTLLDIAQAIELFPLVCQSRSKSGTNKAEYHRHWGLLVACLLRLIQGIAAVFAVFLLVMTESSVIDIVLNFTAVNFISALDDTAFCLAKWGRFGPGLKKEAKRIEGLSLPPSVRSKRIHVWYVIGILPTAAILLTLIARIFHYQNSPDQWITQTFRVQFQEDTSLEAYSGCYHLEKDHRVSQRYIYSSDPHNKNVSKFGYCIQTRQWLFFTEDDNGVNEDYDGNTTIDPCLAQKEQQLAHSSRSNAFDVSTAFGEDWFSFFNTPLDMYFIKRENESESALRENCKSFVNDGSCDEAFNNFFYQYDGGDCCAATCSGHNCGRNAVATPYNSRGKDREIAFERCRDPTMVPLRLTVGPMTEIDPANRTWWANTVVSLEGWEDFWRPFLEVKCDGKTVLATSQLESTMQQGGNSETRMPTSEWESTMQVDVSETVMRTNQLESTRQAENSEIVRLMIDEGAQNCTMTTRNFHLVYSVSSEFVVSPGNTNTKLEVQTKNPIPKEIGNLTGITNLDLSDNSFTGTIPSEIGLNANLSSLLLDNNALTGNIPKELAKLKSLKRLSFSDNALGGPFPWEILLLTQMTELNFDNNFMTGTLPTEIALLTSLTRLSLYNNQFRGLIPSELFTLTNLKVLNLGKNSFFGTIPTQIEALTNLESLHLGDNDFDGSIPEEIESLLLLQELNLSRNSFHSNFTMDLLSLTRLTHLDLGQNSFTSPFPTSIGLLTELRHVDLGNNLFVGEFPMELVESLEQLTHLDLYGNGLTGTFPTAIGKLTNLEYLNLDSVGLTNTIPSEIGNLRQLRHLELDENELTGTIPSQIGRLDMLITLELGQNSLTGSIPTEIGMLTRISGLWMYYNRLSGTIPCQMESLSNLSVLNLNFNYLKGLIPSGLNADYIHVANQRKNQLIEWKDCAVD